MTKKHGKNLLLPQKCIDLKRRGNSSNCISDKHIQNLFKKEKLNQYQILSV